jgi:glutamine amidotransferase
MTSNHHPPRIAIFDYGAGNIFSLKSALERNGASVSVIHDMKGLREYDGLVLPGVGNFDPAIESVARDAESLNAAIKGGMPVMGICLGMEMLFNRSEEGRLEGLKILDGDVVMLPKGKVKVPHMGWNNLNIIAKKKGSKFLKGVKDGSWVYFVHSYRAAPASKKLVVATSDYGTSVPAVIEKENLIGVQFHPEKSGEVGARMIRNFLEMCSRMSTSCSGQAASKKKKKKEQKK